MLYVRPDANAGRRGVFKSTAAPLLPPRRDVAPPPVLCPELPSKHVPRLAVQVGWLIGLTLHPDHLRVLRIVIVKRK